MILLSETHVNKNSEEEPAFLFFQKEIGKLRELMRKFYTAIKTYHNGTSGISLQENQHFFLIEYLETHIYMLLDFCINATS